MLSFRARSLQRKETPPCSAYQKPGIDTAATVQANTGDNLAMGITLFRKVAPGTYYMVESVKPTKETGTVTNAYN